MAMKGSNRHRLRLATASAHDAIEAAMALAAPEDPIGYRQFLAIQRQAVSRCEHLLERSGIAALIPDWSERSRLAALDNDCAALDIAPAPVASSDPLLGEAASFGMLYVLEGSRLGGILLHRRLKDNPDPRCRSADRFLRHGADERLWQSFVAILDRSSIVAKQPDEAVSGAHRAFAAFAEAGEATEILFAE